ncbi:MAG: nucleoside-diphosphate kinase [Victivallaceae bacterium]|nr:nucleoside-diphosphate kinase [Victivallaceae bacterium]
MSVELSYVLITPYSLKKSRTGGILARLLSRTDLDFVGARIFGLDRQFAEAYADSLLKTVGRTNKERAKLLADYVLENFTEKNGKKERGLFLLFKGEGACAKLSSVVGVLDPAHSSSDPFLTGETIRDTYSDLIEDKSQPGVIRYFEPAVLTPPDIECAVKKLKLFADFADRTPNIAENIVGVEDTDERTLVIIKPDNWRHPSSRPGNIIDMLSRTGLRIIGCKVYRMSVREALEFYGPVQGALRSKLAPVIGGKARTILEAELDFKMNDDVTGSLTETVGKSYADDQFYRIIEFMSGRRPTDCPENEMDDPGLVKCLVLIYEGKNAIAKIRNVLGPTDPTKAPGGTVRRDFGSDVMVNTAHASDSPESVLREMGVIQITQNNISRYINEFLKEYNS